MQALHPLLGQQQLHRIVTPAGFCLPASARRVPLLLDASFFPLRTAASQCAQLLPDACPHQRPRLVLCCAKAPLPASLPQRRLSAVAPQRRPGQQRPAQWRPQAAAVALPQRPGQQRPAQWHPQASNSFATAPQPAADSRWLSATAPLPASLSPRRLGQQQTSSGALANRSTTVHPASVSSKAPRPATNLIQRRRVLRFG